MYRIISNIGAAPMKVPPRASPIFPVPIVSALGHWILFRSSAHARRPSEAPPGHCLFLAVLIRSAEIIFKGRLY